MVYITCYNNAGNKCDDHFNLFFGECILNNSDRTSTDAFTDIDVFNTSLNSFANLGRSIII